MLNASIFICIITVLGEKSFQIPHREFFFNITFDWDCISVNLRINTIVYYVVLPQMPSCLFSNIFYVNIIIAHFFDDSDF